jgi:nucleotidyltransferase/DNA polymerase involved in DNA repair
MCCIVSYIAKHVKPDRNGVRIAKLDEMSYRRLLWNYRPLTDFWRVGRGYQKKLEEINQQIERERSNVFHLAFLSV